MMGYKDRTYCSQKNCKNECARKFTEKDHVEAVKWWGSADYPLCVSEYCDDEGKLK